MKALWIAGLMMVLYVTAFNGLTKSPLAASAQTDVDNLVFLHSRSNPFILAASARSGYVSEGARQVPACDQVAAADQFGLSAYVRLHQTRVELAESGREALRQH